MGARVVVASFVVGCVTLDGCSCHSISKPVSSGTLIHSLSRRSLPSLLWPSSSLSFVSPGFFFFVLIPARLVLRDRIERSRSGFLDCQSHWDSVPDRVLRIESRSGQGEPVKFHNLIPTCLSDSKHLNSSRLWRFIIIKVNYVYCCCCWCAHRLCSCIINTYMSTNEWGNRSRLIVGDSQPFWEPLPSKGYSPRFPYICSCTYLITH